MGDPELPIGSGDDETAGLAEAELVASGPLSGAGAAHAAEATTIAAKAV
jgi:hypothetical protein